MNGSAFALFGTGVLALACASRVPGGSSAVRTPTRKLPRGTTVYHGTGSDEDFDTLPPPSWVSCSKDVAIWFAKTSDASRARVLIFKTRSSLKLEVLDDLEVFQRRLEELDGQDDIREFAQNFCAQTSRDGWIITHNYGPNQEDILLCDPDVLEYVGSEPVQAGSRSTSFVPPANVRAAAKLGLDLRASVSPSRRGGTSVGLARARDLSSGRPISVSVLKRMKSYFERHQVDVGKPGWSKGHPNWPSKGLQAWLFWGGDPGRAWVKKCLAQAAKEDS